MGLVKHKKLSKTEYNGLSEKDEDTLYAVNENGDFSESNMEDSAELYIGDKKIGGGENFYGECNISPNTVEKAVTTTNGNFVLKKGAKVSVKFLQGHTANTMDLNVDGTGAIPALRNGTNPTSDMIKGYNVYEFVFDGTYWRIIGVDTHTTSNATSSTAGLMSSTDKTKLDSMATGAGYEANLQWGGRNIADGYSPLDASMISALGANRFNCYPINKVNIEYSRDAGNTWFDYDATDTQKQNLFVESKSSNIQIGGVGATPSINNRVRITIDTANTLYAILRKFVIYVTNNSGRRAYCNVYARKQQDYENNVENWTTLADNVTINGRSGWNVINTDVLVTYGNQKKIQYGQIRFTFGIDELKNSSYIGLVVLQLMAFGQAYSAPNDLAMYDKPYRYNYDGSMVLPNITPKKEGLNIGSSTNKWNEVHASSFYGNLKGNADEAIHSETAILAEDLGGKPETHEENFVYQPTAADLSVKDGFADIKKLKGNTVVWNQRCVISAANCSITNNSENSYIATPMKTGGTLGSGAWLCGWVYFNRKIIAEHKYLIKAKVTRLEKRQDVDDFTPNRLNVMIGSNYKYFDCNIGESVDVNVIIKASADGDAHITCNDCILQVDKPQLIDLTQMFGEGNEPATVEEFEAIFPNQYYEYNEGELMSFDGKGLKSVGFNAFDGEQAKVLKGQKYYLGGTYTALGFKENENSETIAFELPRDRYYTPTSNGYIVATGENICINLSHSGYRNGEYEPYEDYTLSFQDGNTISQLTGKLNGEGDSVTIFPDGLRSAGTVYDEITYDEATCKHKAIKRIGSVDMGTLNWSNNNMDLGSSVFIISSNQVDNINMARNKSTTSPSNMLSVSYYPSPTYSLNGLNNTISGPFPNRLYNGALIVKNTSYTDVDSLKASLQGQILYYELAEPEVYDLDFPINTSYEAYDFGTEEVLYNDDKEVNIPMKANIEYGFNAVDMIRSNYFELQKLKNEGGVIHGDLKAENITAQKFIGDLDGTATKVGHSLTITNGANSVVFDGSEDKVIDIQSLNEGNSIPKFSRIERNEISTDMIVEGSTPLVGEIIYLDNSHPLSDGFYWYAKDGKYYKWWASANLFKNESTFVTLPNKIFECGEDGQQYVFVPTSYNDDGTAIYGQLLKLTDTKMLDVTYIDLKNLVDNKKLIKGMQYRITDFVTTCNNSGSVSGVNTSSANHPFDIIVTADDNGTLNANARVCLHEGDTYFANNKLSEWVIKYDIKNDTDKYQWADTINGKGVIYYMCDEFGNEAPYDFKNILFGNYYTFSLRMTAITDLSLEGKYCYENKIKGNYEGEKLILNHIRMINTTKNTVAKNILGVNCTNIHLTGTCYDNSLSNSCRDITLPTCSNISFASNCVFISMSTGMRNVCVKNGVQGSSSEPLAISALTGDYVTTVAKNSAGVIKIYNEADLVP